MLILHKISYHHPNKDLLFSDIQLSVNIHGKTALIGDNGVGKSTLLRIIAGELKPSTGEIQVDSVPYYIPQLFRQFNQLTIAQALGVEVRLKALKEILNGETSEANFNLLNEDWTIEDRCREALQYWQLDDLNLSQKMATLSGGQKAKVFLSGISIHKPELILLDEPSNHLDISGRELLYNFIRSTECPLIIVSHDRRLLNLPHTVLELRKHELKMYGGNYDFYKEQKDTESNALNHDIRSKEKALRTAKEKKRQTIERQQKLDIRGKGKKEKSGVARIMMNTLRNNAENSTSSLKSIHAEKIDGISQQLQSLRSSLPDINKIKFRFSNSAVHTGKVLIASTAINFGYKERPLWKNDLNFEMASGERIALKGKNGSGKTSLIKLILGQIEPQTGRIYRAEHKVVYLDQDYSLLDNRLKVYEQVEKFNMSALEQHEIKTGLARFLFPEAAWNKPCAALSGGERMRLLLCCLALDRQSADMLIFDEPTNNLDIQNVEILTAAINEYQGAIVVVSHDETFLEQICIQRTIEL